MAEVADMKTRDVAGELFTKTYRDAKIVGKLTEKANYETGSCFDMTVSNLGRAGAQCASGHTRHGPESAFAWSELLRVRQVLFDLLCSRRDARHKQDG